MVSPSGLVSVVNGDSGANFISHQCWKRVLEITTALFFPPVAAFDAGWGRVVTQLLRIYYRRLSLRRRRRAE